MKVLIAIASILLGIGLVAPCLVLHPGAGEYTNLIRMLHPSFTESREISILSGITALYRNGELSIALLLTVFSVIFPAAKLCLLWKAADEAANSQAPHPALTLVERLGKYSMLDVLVLALFVIAMKKLPGGTEAHLGTGTFAFAASIAASMTAPWLISRAQTAGFRG